MSLRHALSQGPVIGAMGRAALSALRPKKGPSTQAVPGPWIEAVLPPRPEALVRDYVRHVGGDPAWYKGALPPHLFPQWGFPLAARAMEALPYPLARVMNAGCRIETNGRLPAGEPLVVRARIESVDENDQRVIVTQRIVTGTKSAPDAVVADLRAYVPLRRSGTTVIPRPKAEEPPGSVVIPRPKAEEPPGARGSFAPSALRMTPGAKAPRTVPADAKEIAFLRIGPRAGLEFAELTGDFNPVHWVPAYARAAGFRACILHGFSTLARAIEALDRARFAGDPTRLHAIDARFTKPLVLPAKVGVYVSGDGIWVGDAPGGAAYLEGTFRTEVFS